MKIALKVAGFMLGVCVVVGCKRSGPDSTPADPKTDAAPIENAKKGIFPSGKPIAPATISAYQEIGAEHGGCVKNIHRYVMEFQPGKEAADKYMPGFRFDKPPAGKLPQVAIPFGLAFGRGAFTEAHLQEVVNLKNLTTLCLEPADVTDTVLRPLHEKRLLHVLGNLTGEIPIPGRPKSADEVTWLVLDDAPVTDAGLKELAPMSNLQIVYMNDTKVTGAGMKHLAHFTKITTLYLGKTGLDDAGLKHLAPLQKLATFNIADTKVTDAGIQDLAALRNLKNVTLIGTGVTETGAARLRQALPKCQVSLKL